MIFQKPAFWVVLILVVLCVVFVVCFLNPGAETPIALQDEVRYDLPPAVMVDGVVYGIAGVEDVPLVGEFIPEGQITSSISYGSPQENDQSNFGTGYDYRYGAMEGTLEVLIDGERCLFATSEMKERICFPRTPRIGLFFAANTSLQEELVLTEGKPFWCITVENKGEEAINVELGGTVYRVEAGTSATIGNDTMWEAGTYTVSFATAGSAGMQGNATCEASAMNHETIGAVIVNGD